MLKAELIDAIVHISARLSKPANTDGTVSELEARLKTLEQDLAQLEQGAMLGNEDSSDGVVMNSPELESSLEPVESLELIDSLEPGSPERIESPAGGDWILLVSNTTIETCNPAGEKLRLVKDQPLLVEFPNASILLSLPYVSQVESDRPSKPLDNE
jgi:hypothetical protein